MRRFGYTGGGGRHPRTFGTHCSQVFDALSCRLILWVIRDENKRPFKMYVVFCEELGILREHPRAIL